MARICKEKQPRVIFCENVRGLLNHDKGRTFEVIKGTFEEIGYDLYWKLIDSQYFGVPQHRERVYMVAFRKDLHVSNFTFPAPTWTATLRSILDPAPVKAKYFLSQQSLNTELARRERNRAAGNGFGIRILDLDGIGNAVMVYNQARSANCFVDDRGIDMSETNGKIPNRQRVRGLTPRESFRMQGFPDDFILPCSDGNTYKQAGNTVTVPVIKAIAEQIKAALLATEKVEEAA